MSLSSFIFMRVYKYKNRNLKFFFVFFFLRWLSLIIAQQLPQPPTIDPSLLFHRPASERHRTRRTRKNDVARWRNEFYYILLFCLSIYSHKRDTRITRAIFISHLKKKTFWTCVFALDEKDSRSSSVVVSFFRQSQKTIVAAAGDT